MIMKKVYFIIMVLMTCMCLTTQSCSSGDDEDFANQNNYSYSDLGRIGTYQGYWMVHGLKADSCVMTYDGKVLSFSKMPIKTIMFFFDSYRRNGYFPLSGYLDSAPYPDLEDKQYIKNWTEGVQLEAGPLVVLPVVVGYSVNNYYFNSSVQQVNLINSEKGYEETYSNMFYNFSTKSGDKTTFFGFLFDTETYGVYNAEQKSRIIKINIKEIEIILPGPERETIKETFNPMLDLTFISNE